MSIKIDQLAEAVLAELNAFSDGVMDDVRKEVRETAKACVANIQANSPADTGDYRDGWTAKVAYQGDDDIRVIVHNKAHYQRTHLLEDGHANVDGGFTPGKPHIAPAADQAAAELEGRIKVVLSNGSG